MPPPPASLEAGPNSPQPGPNVAWTPGYWAWQGGGYAWRPGFWAAVQPNWIWMPPHYVWTPSGYLFVPGYWDLPVANRGLMFAPVYYPQPVYAQPGFVYTPSISIVGSAMTANLFVSVGTNQYLFGNYYAQNFVSVGIVPWFSFSFAVGRPVYYDPLFSYYAVVNVRQNPRWIVQVREAYVLRRDNVAMRPPVTYAEQVRVMRNVSITRNITVIDHRNMAMPLHQLAADPIAGRNLRLVRVAEAERRTIQRQGAELHRVRQQRATLEREVGTRRRGRPAADGERAALAGRGASGGASRPGIPAARVPARPSPTGTRRFGNGKPDGVPRSAPGPNPRGRPRRIGPCPKDGPRPPAVGPATAVRRHDPDSASRPDRPHADAPDRPRREKTTRRPER